MSSNIRYLLSFILIPITLVAADPIYEVRSFEAREVASTYIELVRHNLIHGAKGALRYTPHTAAVNDYDVGTALAPGNWDDSVYVLDLDGIAKSSDTLQNFYKFLSDAGFVVDMGRIYIDRLLNPEKYVEEKPRPNKAKIFHSKLAALYRDFPQDDKNDLSRSCYVMANKRNATYYFHESFTSLIFRHRENEKQSTVNIPAHLQKLFAVDNDLYALLNKAQKINEEILKRITTFEGFIKQCDSVCALDEIKRHEYAPLTLINKINRSRKLYSDAQVVTDLGSSLQSARGWVSERQAALSTMVASPIDVFLLYSYFLLEESKTDLFYGHGFNILAYFSDLDELSISNLLAEPASLVMEQLGYNGDKKEDAPIKSPASNKKSKKGCKVKKVKKKEKKEKKEEPKSLQPLPTLRETKEDEYQKSKKEKQIFLNSLNDTADANNVSMLLRKSHRLLDTLSRLLANVLAIEYENASKSLSLMLFPGQSLDKLIVATKANRANSYIIEALKEIVIQARDEANHTTSIKVLKERNRQIWENIKTAPSQKQRRELLQEARSSRYKIDLKKLYMALNSTDSDPILRAFKNVLNNISADSVVILPNPYNYHSEMVLTEYLQLKKVPLGFIEWNAASIPYQYLGGDLLNCAHCNACLKGAKGIHGLNRAPKIDMIMFTRGSYMATYPGYVPSRRVCLINQVNKFTLLKSLKEIDGIVAAKDCPLHELIKMQYSELSDSDSD